MSSITSTEKQDTSTDSVQAVELFKVSCGDGKYTVIQKANGGLEIHRYGEPWQERVGDKLILTLAQDLEAARAEVAHMKLEVGRRFTVDEMNAVVARKLEEARVAK